MRQKILIIAALLFQCVAVANALAATKVDYTKDVFPILQKYCVGCHTAEEAQGGFVMESHAALMKGGETGVAVTAGEAKSSRMVLMATGKIQPQMPPEDEAQPSVDELAVIANWIDQGAVGPDGDMPVKRELRTPKIATDKNISAPITAIAQSPDGALRAVAQFGNVFIKDATDTPIATIDDLPGKVNSIQFSGDGSRILIASGLTGAYGRAAVYESQTGKRQTEIIGHRDTLYDAVFSPDQTQIATAGYDRNIILWDASTGQQIREFKGHNGAVFDIAFSPDGKILVSACADETVKVWHVATGSRLDTLGQPEGEVYAVEITKDGKFVIAGSCLLYTSPSPRDQRGSRMPSSA